MLLTLVIWLPRLVVNQSTTQDALAVGYRYFDCAEFYGNEAMVGQALKEAGVDRKDLYLVCEWVGEEKIEMKTGGDAPTDRQTGRQAHTDTQTHTHRHTHRHTHTHKHTDTDTHTHTHKHTNTQTHTRTHARTHLGAHDVAG